MKRKMSKLCYNLNHYKANNYVNKDTQITIQTPVTHAHKQKGKKENNTVN